MIRLALRLYPKPLCRSFLGYFECDKGQMLQTSSMYWTLAVRTTAYVFPGLFPSSFLYLYILLDLHVHTSFGDFEPLLLWITQKK